MFSIIPVGGSGVTVGVYMLMGLITAHPDELMNVAEIHDGRDVYSFIVLFREKGSIGSFVAFINEWGTNDGLSGTGGGGYRDIKLFLEDKKIEPEVYDLHLIAEDMLQIVGPTSQKSTSERMVAWSEVVYWMCESMELPRTGINYSLKK